MLGSNPVLPLVYVGGPFRAKTPWAIEQNVRRAETLGLRVAELGATPVIPHSMYRFFQDSLPDEFWLSATLSLLTRCDALILIDGWFWSEGSKAEKLRAEDQRIPVFYNINTLREWLVGERNYPGELCRVEHRELGKRIVTRAKLLRKGTTAEDTDDAA